MTHSTSSVRRLFQESSLTIRALLATIFVGIISWFLLDNWQSNHLRTLFQDHQIQIVREKASENRLLFNLHINNHHQTIKLLAAQKNLADYLDATGIMQRPSGATNAPTEVLFHVKPPAWMPKASVLRNLVPLRYLLLMGLDGRVRELYQGSPDSPPTAMLQPNLLLRQLSHNQTFMTKIDGHPYLITSETVQDDNGQPRAILMLANPLSDIFITASQGIIRQFSGVVALVEGEHPRIIASNRPEALLAGTMLDALGTQFLVADKFYFDYGSSDMLLQLVTLVSPAEFEHLSQSILRAERQQRAINAVALILPCLLIMLWVTRAIGQVTHKIDRASEQILGSVPQSIASRNALTVLQKQFEWFVGEIAQTRDDLHKQLAEKEKAEAEIRKLSQAVEQSPAAVMITDPKGVILYVNAQFAKLTGYSPEEAHGQQPSLLQSGKTPSTVYQELWQTIQAGETWRGDLHNRRKNGETYWERNTISAIRDPASTITHFLAIKEDISLRLEMEGALQQAKEAAEAAYQVKSDFLSNITHELRTPLNAITGTVNLMLDRTFGEIGRDQRRNLHTVLESSNHLATLIDDLLDLSQVDTDQFFMEEERFNLHELIMQTNNAITMQAREKGLALSCRIRPDTPTYVLGDPTRLRQALLHILRNAIKFTRQGLVTMATGADPDPTAPPHSALFTIADTGIGIPKEKLETIFDPFTQVDNSARREFGGTGLGLAIAKRVIQLMRGRIWAESRINEGSTFYISIPLALAQDGSPPTPLLTSFGDTLPKGLRVLLAGDNAVNRLILKKLLISMELEVTEASGCRTAWEMLDSARATPYHLLFLDCSRSATGGAAEVHEARQKLNYATMPVILFNIIPSPAEESALKQLCIYCLHRPIQRVQVYETIKQALLTQSADPFQPSQTASSTSKPEENHAPRLNLDDEEKE